MTLLLRYVAHSEIGLIRKNNQDSGFASPHLIVVADGMGGAAAGDLASAVAIDTVRHVDAGHGRRADARGAGPGGQRGERPDRRPGRLRPGPGRHGHHADRRAVRRQRAGPGPHRRQPGLPAARQHAGTAHPRPQLGAVAGRRRQDQRGRGGQPPAPLAAAQGAERPAGQRPRPAPGARRRRRPADVLQRRASAAWSTTTRSRRRCGCRPWRPRSSGWSPRRSPRAASTTSP